MDPAFQEIEEEHALTPRHYGPLAVARLDAAMARLAGLHGAALMNGARDVGRALGELSACSRVIPGLDRMLADRSREAVQQVLALAPRPQARHALAAVLSRETTIAVVDFRLSPSAVAPSRLPARPPLAKREPFHALRFVDAMKQRGEPIRLSFGSWLTTMAHAASSGAHGLAANMGRGIKQRAGGLADLVQQAGRLLPLSSALGNGNLRRGPTLAGLAQFGAQLIGGPRLSRGISFLSSAAVLTPLGLTVQSGLAAKRWIDRGGPAALWTSTRNFAGATWDKTKHLASVAGHYAQAAGQLLQSPMGQHVVTALSLAATLIPGGVIVKALVGAGLGALAAISAGKRPLQVLSSAAMGALDGVLPLNKLGPMAKIAFGAASGLGKVLLDGKYDARSLAFALGGGALDQYAPGALGKVGSRLGGFLTKVGGPTLGRAWKGASAKLAGPAMAKAERLFLALGQSRQARQFTQRFSLAAGRAGNMAGTLHSVVELGEQLTEQVEYFGHGAERALQKRKGWLERHHLGWTEGALQRALRPADWMMANVWENQTLKLADSILDRSGLVLGRAQRVAAGARFHQAGGKRHLEAQEKLAKRVEAHEAQARDQARLVAQLNADRRREVAYLANRFKRDGQGVPLHVREQTETHARRTRMAMAETRMRKLKGAQHRVGQHGAWNAVEHVHAQVEKFERTLTGAQRQDYIRDRSYDIGREAHEQRHAALALLRRRQWEQRAEAGGEAFAVREATRESLEASEREAETELEVRELLARVTHGRDLRRLEKVRQALAAQLAARLHLAGVLGTQCDESRRTRTSPELAALYADQLHALHEIRGRTERLNRAPHRHASHRHAPIDPIPFTLHPDSDRHDGPRRRGIASPAPLHRAKRGRDESTYDGLGHMSPDVRFVSGDAPKRLDLTLLSTMERFLGATFADVRVHTGPGAAQVTRRYDAEAVAVGKHLFFAPGRFQPSTLEGQKLIAHELTHVTQRGRRNLDVRTAEGEAHAAERAFGAPGMEMLNLAAVATHDKISSIALGHQSAGPLKTAKRGRSTGSAVAVDETPPSGEELLDAVSARVYQLMAQELADDLEAR